jgi:hypothetical protein
MAIIKLAHRKGDHLVGLFDFISLGGFLGRLDLALPDFQP